MGEGAVAGGGVAVVILGLMVWLVKRLVNAALKNMEANTEAIQANTGATQALANTLNQAIAVRDERDKRVAEDLKEIRLGVGNILGRRRGDTD